MSDPARVLASSTVGLPADADADAVRAAFLKQLAESDFVPPEDVPAAVNRLTRERLPLSADGRQEAARYEAADLDAFVATFWQLAPADRTRAWAALDIHCSDPDVRETLARLKPGLSVPVVRHENWPADKMAAFVRDTFLLPPRERGVRRMAWLADQAFSPAQADRVRYLHERDAGTAGLDPQLMHDLLHPPAGPLAVLALPQEQLERIAAQDERAARKAERKAAKQPAEGGWKFSWHYLWVIALVVQVIKGVSSNSPSKPPATYTPVPKVQMDADNLQQAVRQARYALYQYYDPASGQPKPDGYDAWVKAGKPHPSEILFPGPHIPNPTQAEDIARGFSAEQIGTFQAHVPRAGWADPPGYAAWVLAGRPNTPTPPATGEAGPP